MRIKVGYSATEVGCIAFQLKASTQVTRNHLPIVTAAKRPEKKRRAMNTGTDGASAVAARKTRNTAYEFVSAMISNGVAEMQSLDRYGISAHKFHCDPALRLMGPGT